jgi:hypothetical protein
LLETELLEEVFVGSVEGVFVATAEVVFVGIKPISGAQVAGAGVIVTGAGVKRLQLQMVSARMITNHDKLADCLQNMALFSKNLYT